MIEHDESIILDNLQKRGRGSNVANKERQEAFANASKLFGQQLAQEAQNNRIPVLAARPKETILARTLETIR